MSTTLFPRPMAAFDLRKPEGEAVAVIGFGEDDEQLLTVDDHGRLSWVPMRSIVLADPNILALVAYAEHQLAERLAE